MMNCPHCRRELVFGQHGSGICTGADGGRVVHLDTRRGEPCCRADEEAPRLTLHPDLVTCRRCRNLPQWAVRVRARERTKARKAAAA